jgi:hypothetical protein
MSCGRTLESTAASPNTGKARYPFPGVPEIAGATRSRLDAGAIATMPLSRSPWPYVSAISPADSAAWPSYECPATAHDVDNRGTAAAIRTKTWRWFTR